ncbi:hypothetical protein M427DRAFT_53611 [Gonapodya prolifera JEL478]|uniref:Uncharacterized protein n=1 Tax=Gonapodya prolifera (strain JEL478) TaxID=1344416 RepID=A0A139AQ92_GONPJ|nr:hypothetical protein M427DRAFT_53611 [Gonapodya prolifera JEL478]|eukprot:KXS18673.1 hypothetical protein M427DRAFT_53611 [Gonapodya prolifera JEL478]
MTSPFVLPLFGVGSDVKGRPYFISPIVENKNVGTYLRVVQKVHGVGDGYQEEVLGCSMTLPEACCICTKLRTSSTPT